MGDYNPETGMFSDEWYTKWVADARRGRYAVDTETPAQKTAFYSELDKGIAHYVRILAESGIETCQSCEGGKGHAYPEPTVDFMGSQQDAWKAYSVARTYGLPVSELRQIWRIQDDVPTGPLWSIIFSEKSDNFIVRTEKREQLVHERMGKIDHAPALP